MAALFAKEMNVKTSVSVLPMWLMKILGIVVPVMREMPEMMYQYDRDYFFDSAKFDKRFTIKTTTYQEGVRRTVDEAKG